MVKTSDIILVLLNDMPSPEPAFKLMLAFCAKTNKNVWEEFGYTFSNSAKTIIGLHKVGKKLYPIGFWNIQYEQANDVYFVNQGYLHEPVDDPNLLCDNIYYKVMPHLGMGYKKLVMHSEHPERLWNKWGYTKSKTIIYEKQVAKRE